MSRPIRRGLAAGARTLSLALTGGVGVAVAEEGGTTTTTASSRSPATRVDGAVGGALTASTAPALALCVLAAGSPVVPPLVSGEPAGPERCPSHPNQEEAR